MHKNLIFLQIQFYFIIILWSEAFGNITAWRNSEYYEPMKLSNNKKNPQQILMTHVKK